MSGQVRGIQGIRLAFRTIRVRNTVDDLLCLVARNLLVVGLDVAQVVATAVVRLAHAHAVVCEVHIAIVAEELRHVRDSASDYDASRDWVALVCGEFVQRVASSS